MVFLKVIPDNENVSKSFQKKVWKAPFTLSVIENYTLAVRRSSMMIQGILLGIRRFLVFEDDPLSLANPDSKLEWQN